VIDPRRLPPTTVVRFVATVADLATVQRVLMMVVGRRHPLTHFEATETPDARWRVTLDCPMGDQDPALLLERLRRAPCVLTVRSLPGRAGPPTTSPDPP
jgi:hypothetical protein